MQTLKDKKFMIIMIIALLMATANLGTAQAASGTAIISGTSDGSTVSGAVSLTDTPEGLKVSATFKNVPPGKHGFHIHENGACGDTGKEAGGHFNPAKVDHGLLSKDGFEHAHAGDFGNIEIAEDGTGSFEVVEKGLTLSEGEHAVAGKAFILHEKEDDFGQPTGNAGGRIGCDIIELTE